MNRRKDLLEEKYAFYQLSSFTEKEQLFAKRVDPSRFGLNLSIEDITLF